MAETRRVLLVGPVRQLGPDLARALSRRQLDVSCCSRIDEAVRRITDESFDVVAAAFELHDGTAIDLAARLDDARPEVPVLVLTESPSLDTAVAALRAGAWDYHVWPMPVEALVLALERGIQHRRLKREVRRLEEAPGWSGDRWNSSRRSDASTFAASATTPTSRSPTTTASYSSPSGTDDAPGSPPSDRTPCGHTPVPEHPHSCPFVTLSPPLRSTDRAASAPIVVAAFDLGSNPSLSAIFHRAGVARPWPKHAPRVRAS